MSANIFGNRVFFSYLYKLKRKNSLISNIMKANMLSMMKTLREKYVILVWLFILSMSVVYNNFITTV